ncbi:MAG: hypothetical protein COV55_03680 [Candidatus Komeilibacteria bacterium CG11_big_fil_rev_8_21_14_0_20_36_20]|uniref:HTH cro/C1-type domain-containing protein n=1 Tax=Candidatus Komeilibacteria bacterium CG11_big_fil_rev_8_21_14_0_20_36_20 TaxID=1974477 RepID=A0A2H0NCI9_9BACT|nr:MAG: hypothetical protein COV55_03680 [Candidatus Komeilibacteria bacterium CG11_big_fil_rev_8_21_14_0_20_36_20]PJC55343.1 MAG: hypothetical protein CO027_02320 [Candidatus Komeilibacteria bacterium CG_4_9_14_0_2_um_filter_36_13]
MSKFKKKTISKGQTLADKLRKARLDKNVSLEEVQSAIKVQTRYLDILENGQYDQLPGDIYTKAWIKLYADFLDLPSSELLADYNIEKNISHKIKKFENQEPNTKKYRFSFLRPRYLKIFIIILVVASLLGYLGFELINIVAPPKIIILEPTNNLKTTESSISIVGSTEAEVQLTINDETIVLDDQGNFNQSINLAVGLNNLQISAKKKHSRTRELELVILREVLE